METYIGKITKVYYRNENYLIALFKNEEDKNSITIKGFFTGVSVGEKIKICGASKIHPKFGPQFDVTQWERPIPSDKEQIIAFLQSSAIKGVGNKLATLIVEKLGANTLNQIINEGYQCLIGIKGINEKKAIKIANSVKESFLLQEMIKELQSYGIEAELTIKAYTIYGDETIKVIKNNPYKLMDISNISFPRNDEIARNLGVCVFSKVRITACIKMVLQESCFNGGHCYVEENQLIKQVRYILNYITKEEKNKLTEQEENMIIAAIEETTEFINEQGNVYLKKLYEAEKNVAIKVTNFITTQIKGHLFTNTDLFLSKINEKIKQFQIKTNTVLAEKQREAIRKFMTHNFMVLTGGPGTGKTFTVNGIIEVFRSLYPDKKRIALTAPSGRAARNLFEVTGIKESYTMHLLLGYRQGEEPEYNRTNPLPYDLIVVDEFSMVDILLATHFFDAVDIENTKILFVGDYDQLPSVGPGNVLRELLSIGVPQVRLTEIFRQSQSSQIVINAHRINKGQNIIIDTAKEDYYFIEKENPIDISRMIIKSIKRFIELDYDISDIMVLSPMKKGIIGRQELNKRIQEEINPKASNKRELKSRGGTIFREGDKIIQIKNNREKDVYNGDIGIIKAIDDKDGKTEVYCQFNQRMVIYEKEELNELEHAFCITIHKSQGTQAKIVIMPMSMIHERMLVRNLFYTGQTRSKEIVVLIGTKKAIQKAILTEKTIQRNTNLKNRVNQYLNSSGTPIYFNNS